MALQFLGSGHVGERGVVLLDKEEVRSRLVMFSS